MLATELNSYAKVWNWPQTNEPSSTSTIWQWLQSPINTKQWSLRSLENLIVESSISKRLPLPCKSSLPLLNGYLIRNSPLSRKSRAQKRWCITSLQRSWTMGQAKERTLDLSSDKTLGSQGLILRLDMFNAASLVRVWAKCPLPLKRSLILQGCQLLLMRLLLPTHFRKKILQESPWPQHFKLLTKIWQQVRSSKVPDASKEGQCLYICPIFMKEFTTLKAWTQVRNFITSNGIPTLIYWQTVIRSFYSMTLECKMVLSCQNFSGS